MKFVECEEMESVSRGKYAKLVRDFMDSGLRTARVDLEGTSFSAAYQGLWRILKHTSVRMVSSNGIIYLINDEVA